MYVKKSYLHPKKQFQKELSSIYHCPRPLAIIILTGSGYEKSCGLITTTVTAISSNRKLIQKSEQIIASCKRNVSFGQLGEPCLIGYKF